MGELEDHGISFHFDGGRTVKSGRVLSLVREHHQLRAARHIAVGAHPLDQALDQAEAAASALAALENLTWELIPT